MTEPRIVDAVEVARPEYWIGVSVRHGTVHLWSSSPRKSSDELMESVKQFVVPPQFIVRLPGTDAPAPATATDAVEELLSRKLMPEFRSGITNMIMCSVFDKNLGCVASASEHTYQAAATACLAKIRGGR